MILFVIVNKATGEMEDNCSMCMIGGTDDLSLFPVDENHIIFEITGEEKAALDGSVQNIAESEKTEFEEGEKRPKTIYIYTKKFDIEKITQSLDEREKVDDLSKPIEIENMGGIEIIAYEQKPVSIIIERSDQKVDSKPKLEK